MTSKTLYTPDMTADAGPIIAKSSSEVTADAGPIIEEPSSNDIVSLPWHQRPIGPYKRRYIDRVRLKHQT